MFETIAIGPSQNVRPSPGNRSKPGRDQRSQWRASVVQVALGRAPCSRNRRRADPEGWISVTWELQDLARPHRRHHSLDLRLHNRWPSAAGRGACRGVCDGGRLSLVFCETAARARTGRYVPWARSKLPSPFCPPWAAAYTCRSARSTSLRSSYFSMSARSSYHVFLSGSVCATGLTDDAFRTSRCSVISGRLLKRTGTTDDPAPTDV